MTEQTKLLSKDEQQALESVIKKANAGDQKALATLRKILDQQPQFWNEIGDIAKIAESAVNTGQNKELQTVNSKIQGQ